MKTIERSSWHTGLVVLSGNFVIDSCAMCMDDMDTTDTKTTLSATTNYPTNHKEFASKIKWKTNRRKKYAGGRRSDGKRRRGDADRRASLDVTLTRKDADAPSLAHAQRPMAPQNTTQYLMAANVYADMPPPQQQQHGDTSSVALDVYGESLSPASFSAALDAVYYDEYLAFQQRDFDEVLGRL